VILDCKNGLIGPAIDEFLRYHSVSPAIARTVCEDVEIDGVRFKRGERVLVFLTAANHQEATFPCPHQIDIERDCRANLAFGFGQWSSTAATRCNSC
jgi:cytochrome P450